MKARHAMALATLGLTLALAGCAGSNPTLDPSGAVDGFKDQAALLSAKELARSAHTYSVSNGGSLDGFEPSLPGVAIVDGQVKVSASGNTCAYARIEASPTATLAPC